MFGGDFLLKGGKGGLGFSSSSKAISGGNWNGSVHYPNTKGSRQQSIVLIIVVAVLVLFFGKGDKWGFLAEIVQV